MTFNLLESRLIIYLETSSAASDTQVLQNYESLITNGLTSP